MKGFSKLRGTVPLWQKGFRGKVVVIAPKAAGSSPHVSLRASMRWRIPKIRSIPEIMVGRILMSMWFFGPKHEGPYLGSPYSIVGSILKPPIFGNTQMVDTSAASHRPPYIS